MKLKVIFNEKSLDCTINDEITNLSQVTQKLCSLFLLTNYYSYSLFLTNGQLIDNINLVEDGSEIIIKHLNKLGSGGGNSNNVSTPISIPNSNITTLQQQQNNNSFSISPNTPNTPNNLITPTTGITTTTGLSIDNLLINLKDNVFKKKAFFDLKDLKEEVLIKKFVEKNGIELIVEQLKELTGNTLSYALSALVTIMSYDFGIPTSLTDITSLITQILPMTENTSNPSICKTSLQLLCIFLNQGNNVNFKQFSNFIVKEYNEKTGRDYIGNTLVQLLSSSNTVDVQLNSLTLLNIIIGKTYQLDGELAFNELLVQLDKNEINQKLKKLVEQIIAPELKRQLFIYQRHRFQVITNRKNVTFNKESTEHDALLTKLWNLTFPNVKLESKVSEQWKLMGFQGTDPCTDFRAMGIWGLDNLIYFAANHNEKFKKIINSQAERKDREYPTATAGIVITFELYNSIFKIGSNINAQTTPVDELPFFPLFFSHPHAFEEVYCTTFQILDSTWDDMNGTYMHFQKIMSSVKNLIITALESKPTTLEAFDWKCQKNTKNSGSSSGGGANSNSNSLMNHANSSGVHNNSNNKDNPEIKRLLTIINKQVLDTIKLQKTQYLLEGFQFKLSKPLKTKQSLVLNWIFIRLSNEQQQDQSPIIQYCFLPFELQQLPSPQNSLMTNFNTIKINDIQIIESNNIIGNTSGGTGGNSSSGGTGNTGGISIGGSGKKKDKSNSIQFSISIKDDQFQNLIQNQQPPTQVIGGGNNNSSNSGSGCNSPSLDGGNISSNSSGNNNNNTVSSNTPNLGSPNTTSPMMIPQPSSSSAASSLPISSPSSPILSHQPNSSNMASSPLSSSSSSSSNSNNIDLVSTNKEDLSNFWDAIRLLSGQDIKSPEGIEDYQSLLSINTSVRLLDLDGIDIPKEIPTIPILPENYDFRS